MIFKNMDYEFLNIQDILKSPPPNNLEIFQIIKNCSVNSEKMISYYLLKANKNA